MEGQGAGWVGSMSSSATPGVPQKLPQTKRRGDGDRAGVRSLRLAMAHFSSPGGVHVLHATSASPARGVLVTRDMHSQQPQV